MIPLVELPCMSRGSDEAKWQTWHDITTGIRVWLAAGADYVSVWMRPEDIPTSLPQLRSLAADSLIPGITITGKDIDSLHALQPLFASLEGYDEVAIDFSQLWVPYLRGRLEFVEDDFVEYLDSFPKHITYIWFPGSMGNDDPSWLAAHKLLLLVSDTLSSVRMVDTSSVRPSALAQDYRSNVISMNCALSTSHDPIPFLHFQDSEGYWDVATIDGHRQQLGDHDWFLHTSPTDFSRIALEYISLRLLLPPNHDSGEGVGPVTGED